MGNCFSFLNTEATQEQHRSKAGAKQEQSRSDGGAKQTLLEATKQRRQRRNSFQNAGATRKQPGNAGATQEQRWFVTTGYVDNSVATLEWKMITPSEAEAYARSLGERCGGFTYQGKPTEGPIQICFKANKGFEVVRADSGWTTVWRPQVLDGPATPGDVPPPPPTEMCKYCKVKATWNGKPGYCGREHIQLAKAAGTYVPPSSDES